MLESGPKSKITVRLDGRTFDFDLAYGGKSILDAALSNGAVHQHQDLVCIFDGRHAMADQNGRTVCNAHYTIRADGSEASTFLPQCPAYRMDFQRRVCCSRNCGE